MLSVSNQVDMDIHVISQLAKLVVNHITFTSLFDWFSPGFHIKKLHQIVTQIPSYMQMVSTSDWDVILMSEDSHIFYVSHFHENHVI